MIKNNNNNNGVQLGRKPYPRAPFQAPEQPAITLSVPGKPVHLLGLGWGVVGEEERLDY